ncbi:quinoprotein dehydrogenase-associated putative ABC transporter substrate-binding protein [Methylophaga sp. OBS4]|uniref:quinoprotein dehydrogenase-associated putative ABC transporter substrate-binding protein n=1 Tax=Methylophaga sp. OBS4 TaxID=2991935 RepID=UPI00225A7E5C|nr:quinoprotein dehydrogenase-associated putative ABC transporter substrate-binding protein [Methylophaga sp. OBS4]MCX4188394.1 quinoprotein dehydrogenase-associated putative ABC transporter substrate-binding protein [Methylophaga sp. OBS4]
MTQFQRWTILLSGLLLGSVSVNAEDLKPLPGQEAVRVCADGYNLPYSNKELQGFDNKIAELLGEELGLPVEYYWFPQRIGFSRNTIKKVDPETGKFLCDVAMSIPEHTDFLKPTQPYWSSIEAMVYRSGEGYELNSIADIAKVSKEQKPLRIGIFDRGITTKALLDLGLADQIQYFQMMPGDAKVNAGRVVEQALANGEIDVALMWGPIAGYYASVSKVPMTMKPLNELGERFIFSFSMGTRYQDKAWNQLLNKFLEKRKDDIAAIMAQYNLPSLENVNPYPKKRVRKDDDDD